MRTTGSMPGCLRRLVRMKPCPDASALEVQDAKHTFGTNFGRQKHNFRNQPALASEVEDLARKGGRCVYERTEVIVNELFIEPEQIRRIVAT